MPEVQVYPVYKMNVICKCIMKISPEKQLMFIKVKVSFESRYPFSITSLSDLNIFVLCPCMRQHAFLYPCVVSNNRLCNVVL